MDLGRDEFDWGRMRREEDDYLAARSRPLAILGPMLEAVVNRAAAKGRLDAEQQAEVDRLRSMPYEAYLQTDHWRETRQRCLGRDGRQCRRCASRQNLEVHHLTYERRGQERAIDVITLCYACHKLAHSRG